MSKKKEFAIATKSGNIVTENIYDRYALKSSDNAKSNKIVDDRFSAHYDDLGLIKPLHNMSALTNLVENNPYHQRCVHTKAQDVAGLGYNLVPAEDGKEADKNKERLKDLFEEGPPFVQTLTRFEIDYQATGNAYLELVREGHLPEAEYKLITHIPAHTMRIHKDQNRYVQVRGKKRVWFKRVGFEKDVNKHTGEISGLGNLSPDKRASEIIHDYNYCPRSDFYGVPDHISALGAIIGHLSQRDYNIKFFENFGIPAYAIYITGDYELEIEEGEDEPGLIKQIRQFLDEVQTEPHSSLIFGIPASPTSDRSNVQVEFKPLAVETKDAAFRMYRQDNRDEVIVAHGVPPYRIGIAASGSLGGNTAQESTKIYQDSVINPRETSIEYFINEYIIQKNYEIYDWEFELESLGFEDDEHDKDMLEMMFENGAASPNDLIRNLGASYGIEPVDHPAMDDYYVNGIPITADQTDDVVVEDALKTLQEKLLQIAVKQKESKEKNAKNR